MGKIFGQYGRSDQGTSEGYFDIKGPLSEREFDAVFGETEGGREARAVYKGRQRRRTASTLIGILGAAVMNLYSAAAAEPRSYSGEGISAEATYQDHTVRKQEKEKELLDWISTNFPAGERKAYSLGEILELRGRVEELESLFNGSYDAVRQKLEEGEQIRGKEFEQARKERFYEVWGNTLDAALSSDYVGDMAFVTTGPPELPHILWDSPIDCPTCDPYRGAFIDGLPVPDGSTVIFQMDCDDNGEPESNVNQGFPNTLMGGAYLIIVPGESDTTCGVSATNQNRQYGDAEIGGLLARPKNLALEPGGDTQQRLDTNTYSFMLERLSPSQYNPDIDDEVKLNWLQTGGSYNAVWGYILSKDEEGFIGLREGFIGLRDGGGLAGATVNQVGCGIEGPSISTTISSLEPCEIGLSIPARCNAQFIVLSEENGNYGATSDGTPRRPPSGDCP